MKSASGSASSFIEYSNGNRNRVGGPRTDAEAAVASGNHRAMVLKTQEFSVGGGVLINQLLQVNGNTGRATRVADHRIECDRHVLHHAPRSGWLKAKLLAPRHGMQV